MLIHFFRTFINYNKSYHTCRHRRLPALFRWGWVWWWCTC